MNKLQNNKKKLISQLAKFLILIKKIKIYKMFSRKIWTIRKI